MREANDSQHHEPQHHHGAEECGDLRCPTRLHREQADQDHDRQRHDVMFKGRRREFETFHRGQNRDRRRDDAVAVEHGGADHAQHQNEGRTPSQRARRQRGKRKRAALTVVVGAQQDDDVFDRDRDNERPYDHGKDAEHDLFCNCAAMADRRGYGFAERIKRARADVAIDNAGAADDQP